MIFTKSRRSSLNIKQEIKTLISGGRTEELLLIVPTNRKSRYLKREIISASPGKTAASINIETIGTFSQKMISENDISSGRILSDAASAVLLKQAFMDNNLKYFSIYKDDIPSGTIERVKNVISRYKKNGITPELLLKESGTLEGAEKIKAEDIAAVYASYNIICGRLGVKEIGDIYSELNNLDRNSFQTAFASLYPKVKLIMIDGFDEFTLPEIEIINALSEVSAAELFIEFDYYGLNESVFAHLDKCYSRLLEKGFRPFKIENEDASDEFRNIIKKKLFSRTEEKINGFRIFKIEAQSREKEIEYIAKDIKDLIISGKAEPGQICVVFNLIKKYSPLIRDIFQSYGIPFNLTDRYQLSQSSPVIGIINFLEISENDYYYKNIFRALSAGYILPDKVNLSNLYKASVKLKIISGYQNWVSTLENAAAAEKNEENGGSRSRIITYEKALEDIKKLHGVLGKFEKKMSVMEFRALLVETIFTLDIHSSLVNNKTDNIEENIKGLTAFINTMDEMFELLKIEEEDNKLPLKYFLHNIRTAVSGARFNIKEKPGYGVQVTNLNEIRGLRFDYLFIGGLCDGDLPTRYTPEIFFSGSYSKNEQNHQTEERYHFYQSLCSWNKELYLTYPLYDENKELVKSTHLVELEQLFSAESKDTSEYEQKIYSKEELLKHLGKKIQKSLTNNEETAPEYKEMSEAVKINNLRTTSPFGDSEFTGRIFSKLDDVSKTALKEYCLGEFSVSQLEIYAGCPFRYFAERVLGLNTIEEPAEEIEARELGSLLHNILYKFYTEISRRNIRLKNASDKCFSTAVNLIFSIAGEEIKSASFSPLTFYEKEKILGINGNPEHSILYKFLQAERDTKDDFKPSFFEISFGDLPAEKGEKGEVLKHFKAGSVKVRGKIDRIDIDETNGLYKVLDYKTGSARPTEKDVAAGLSLQLPLYMTAARELIKHKLNKEFRPAGAEIFSLKYSEDSFSRFHLINTKGGNNEANPEVYEAAAEQTINIIENYVKSIAAGEFNLTQLEKRETTVCKYCSYKSLCRIEDVK